ncbi:T. brucei spp.-specific protein [Trypanosoma brucei gambiense DAL972]|uniref:T. brucei spp.-specific protein n=1 Tax=Trypanosoma brucei gambiense (strain MHOM/CI/86/DAL972) TaxID=679716 RepID=D0A3A2_TRYB9|nr:T. brucei spp.-specific protein [Trypanosoma brucei gambiense DAL972]CBH15746.1 T. brucei spp.-specific protein [Trypanosoma brucei gambiense DAL972]|eukprot:XP_011778010.1 T. brucei spp.-specific protein [Trypanosoma brucei gambiense DAL972]
MYEGRYRRKRCGRKESFSLPSVTSRGRQRKLYHRGKNIKQISTHTETHTHTQLDVNSFLFFFFTMKQKRKGMLLSHCAVPVGRNLSVGPHTIKHSAQTKTFLTVTFFLEHRNGHSTRLHPPLPTAYISSLFFPHAIALHSLLPHRSSASINERRRNKAKIATTCRVRAGAHITLFTYGQPLMSTFSP